MDRANWRVYCIPGDGELNEGSIWEAIMFAGHHRFGNLVAIVDRNKIQGNGWTEETVRLEPLADKREAFGWDVINVEDGNDMEQIVDVLGALPPVDPVTPRRPICIILNTVKGKGVAFMENEPKWHAGGLSAEKKDECLRLIEQSSRSEGNARQNYMGFCRNASRLRPGICLCLNCWSLLKQIKILFTSVPRCAQGEQAG